MALPKLPQGLSEAQYQKIFAGTNGVYKGNNKAYYGKSWGDVYAAIYAADVAARKPGATPYRVALAVESLMFIQGDIGSLVTSLGNFVTISGKSAVGGIDQFQSNPLSGIADFIGMLGQPRTWLRVGEGILGIALIIVALDKSLGGSGTAGKAVRTVAKGALLA